MGARRRSPETGSLTVPEALGSEECMKKTNKNFKVLSEAMFSAVLSAVQAANVGVPADRKVEMRVEVRCDNAWMGVSLAMLGDEGEMLDHMERFFEAGVGSQEVFGRKVESLVLSRRTVRLLLNEAHDVYISGTPYPIVATVGELARMTPSDLIKRRGFGRTTLAEVEREMARLGLRLGMRNAGRAAGGS
jgi:hypothetical protein